MLLYNQKNINRMKILCRIGELEEAKQVENELIEFYKQKYDKLCINRSDRSNTFFFYTFEYFSLLIRIF
jgi:hypothetical protein